MAWSMDSVSFRMAGYGNWQNLLPDEASRQFYARIYPDGLLLEEVPGKFKRTVASWQEAGIVRVEGISLVPLGPIMTDRDLEVLSPWFHDVSDSMAEAVHRCLQGYRSLARGMCAAPTKAKVDNLVTILTCAQALDIWAFQALRYEIIGPHPFRGMAGRFFFWGYAFAAGPGGIFGVSTYGRGETVRISVLRSHRLDRGELPVLLRQEAVMDYVRLCLRERPPKGARETLSSLREVGLVTPDALPHLAVPVFTDSNMEQAAILHKKVTADIVSGFQDGMERLEKLISDCSFVRCSRPDVLAMLFHLAYSYAADRLVGTGAIPDFPGKAGGEWGVWITVVGESPPASAY